MLLEREDGIWDVVCESCQMRLTEVITNPMPTTVNTAAIRAWEAGWKIDPDQCAGCANV